jgi:hypothetical protein
MGLLSALSKTGCTGDGVTEYFVEIVILENVVIFRAIASGSDTVGEFREAGY